jgi:hypothetical protein
MPVSFEFLLTLSLFKDLRFLARFIFFQQRSQKPWAAIGDGQMINDAHENEKHERHNNGSH